ncbi:MAG: hypothetical protein KF878_33120 [Planctomycetes bacterium]|nr:hypothetical protein [Planctomycetota bacterium]
MTRRNALLLALATAGAALAAGRAGADGEAARPLVVAAAGEVLGNLEPCNCVQGMLGGMPRRLAALARERRRADVVALDGGDLTGRDLHPRLLEAKTRAALELLARGEAAAVAVGEKDLRLGHVALARAAAGAGVTLLGANLTLAAGVRRRPPAPRGRRLVVVARRARPGARRRPSPRTLDVGGPAAAAGGARRRAAAPCACSCSTAPARERAGTLGGATARWVDRPPQTAWIGDRQPAASSAVWLKSRVRLRDAATFNCLGTAAVSAAQLPASAR